MKFDTPKALFSGLTLIAAAIYFGPGAATATPTNESIQKVAICSLAHGRCLDVVGISRGTGNDKTAEINGFVISDLK